MVGQGDIVTPECIAGNDDSEVIPKGVNRGPSATSVIGLSLIVLVVAFLVIGTVSGESIEAPVVLTDPVVTISSPANGQAIYANGSVWINWTAVDDIAVAEGETAIEWAFFTPGNGTFWGYTLIGAGLAGAVGSYDWTGISEAFVPSPGDVPFIIVTVNDTDGNPGNNTVSPDPRYDTTGPVLNLNRTFLTESFGATSSFLAINGTASDAESFDVTYGEWHWDGDAAAPVTFFPTGNWNVWFAESVSTTYPAAQGPGNYSLNITVFDSEGNPSNVGNFYYEIVDVTPPVLIDVNVKGTDIIDPVTDIPSFPWDSLIPFKDVEVPIFFNATDDVGLDLPWLLIEMDYCGIDVDCSTKPVGMIDPNEDFNTNVVNVGIGEIIVFVGVGNPQIIDDGGGQFHVTVNMTNVGIFSNGLGNYGFQIYLPDDSNFVWSGLHRFQLKEVDPPIISNIGVAQAPADTDLFLHVEILEGSGVDNTTSMFSWSGVTTGSAQGNYEGSGFPFTYRYNHTIPGVSLSSSGILNVTFVVEDVWGNVGQLDFNVNIVSGKPVINLVSPANQSALADFALLTINVTDDSGLNAIIVGIEVVNAEGNSTPVFFDDMMLSGPCLIGALACQVTYNLTFDQTDGPRWIHLNVTVQDDDNPVFTEYSAIEITDQTSPSADPDDLVIEIAGGPSGDDKANFSSSNAMDNWGVASAVYWWPGRGQCTVQSVNLSDPTLPCDSLLSSNVTGNFSGFLIMIDKAGNSNNLSFQITIYENDTSPVADAGADQSVYIDTLVVFNGTGSFDDNGIVNHTWTFWDGGIVTLFGPQPNHIFTDPGTFLVTLVVRDTVGLTDDDSMRFFIDSETTLQIGVNGGWNLLSIPLNLNGTITEVFDDSAGDGATIWDLAFAYSGSGGWISFNAARPAYLNTLVNVDNSMGIWLNVTALGDALMTVRGPALAPSIIILQPGWNLVGYPSASPAQLMDALSGLSWDRAAVGNDLVLPYHLQPMGLADWMLPGKGYWISVTVGSVWVLP